MILQSGKKWESGTKECSFCVDILSTGKQLGRLLPSTIDMDTTDGIYAGNGIPCPNTIFLLPPAKAACVHKRRRVRSATGGQDGSHKKFCSAEESASGKLGNLCSAEWVDMRERRE